MGGRVELDPAVNDLSNAVIGAAIEVHRLLGPGFLESVYEEALCVELELRGIRHTRQAPVSIQYKGRSVGGSRIDILVADRLIVELKAIDMLGSIHSAQLMSYLRATNCQLGLLINFNVTLLRNGVKRVILSTKD